MLQATGHKVPCRSASRPVCPTRRLAVGPKAFRESGPEQPKTPVRSVFIVDIDNPKRCKVDYDNQEDYAAWLTRMGTGGLESEDGSVAYLKLEELEDGRSRRGIGLACFITGDPLQVGCRTTPTTPSGQLDSPPKAQRSATAKA